MRTRPRGQKHGGEAPVSWVVSEGRRAGRVTGVRPRVCHVETPRQGAWGGGELAGPAGLREGGRGRQAWLTWAWRPAGRGAGLDFMPVAGGSRWKGANRGTTWGRPLPGLGGAWRMSPGHGWGAPRAEAGGGSARGGRE